MIGLHLEDELQLTRFEETGNPSFHLLNPDSKKKKKKSFQGFSSWNPLDKHLCSSLQQTAKNAVRKEGGEKYPN